MYIHTVTFRSQSYFVSNFTFIVATKEILCGILRGILVIIV